MSRDAREALLRVIDANPRISDKTKKQQRAAVERWSMFARGDWTPMNAQAFYNHLLVQKGRTGTAKIKPQSANGVIIHLRSVTRQWAALNQDPKLAIFEPVQLRKDEAPEQAIVLDEMQAQQLVHVRSGMSPAHLRDFSIVILGLQTGMRRMSFVGATLAGTSLDNGYMTVPVKGKGTFDVPLSSAAVAALRPWIDWLRAHDVRSGSLFWSFQTPSIERSGDIIKGPLTLRGFDEIVSKLSRDSGVDELTPHAFRHTFVTWCRLAGVDSFKIAAVTGHAERSVGGDDGMIAGVYSRRALAGAAAAEAIAKPWMFRR